MVVVLFGASERSLEVKCLGALPTFQCPVHPFEFAVVVAAAAVGGVGPGAIAVAAAAVEGVDVLEVVEVEVVEVVGKEFQA